MNMCKITKLFELSYLYFFFLNLRFLKHSYEIQLKLVFRKIVCKSVNKNLENFYSMLDMGRF